MAIPFASLLAVSKFQIWAAPLWVVGLAAIGAMIAMVLIYLAARTVFPRASAIAMATTQEQLTQPLFWLLVFIGTALLAIFPYLPYFTLGDDLKIVKDSGLTLIKVAGAFLALWTASTSISSELEGKTALMILSKHRRFEGDGAVVSVGNRIPGDG